MIFSKRKYVQMILKCSKNIVWRNRNCMGKGDSDKVRKCFISFQEGYCCCVIEYTF